jgi:isoquinoline 1-oxidoreductase subunit beta
MKKTTNTKQLDRRSFLQVSALAGGGLMIGIYAPSAIAQGRGGGPAAAPVPSNFITINPNNTSQSLRRTRKRARASATRSL